MKRYTMPGLYAAFCLSWAGVITCVVLHEDVGGRWPWMLSVCAALLFTLLLLLVWLWRLGGWLVQVASRGARGAVPAGRGDAVLLGIPRFHPETSPSPRMWGKRDLYALLAFF